MDKQALPVGISAAVAAIADGLIEPQQLTQAYLERITQAEAELGAWAFLDPQYALKQAQKADYMRRAGRDIGPLHGVPLGVADVVDTQDMPCEWGSPYYSGRQCAEDAQLVSVLRAAGAVLLGKCATSECGLLTEGKTRHPQATAQPVLGGAAGSAVAVASGMLPGAVALQGEGDLIQAAAQCGIVGYVPSAGLISRRGVMPRSPTLDHMGVLTRTLDDAALLAQTLMVYDDADKQMSLCARPRLVKGVGAQPPVLPRFGVVQTPPWDRADTAMQASMGELLEALSAHTETENFPLSSAYAAILDGFNTLFSVELAHSLSAIIPETAQHTLSPALHQRLAAAQTVSATEYLRVLEQRQRLRRELEPLFLWCDVLITPASHGAIGCCDQATLPLFSLPWSFLGLPTLTLPLFEDESGLPMGLQLVGAPYGDSRLLRTANWLLRQLVNPR